MGLEIEEIACSDHKGKHVLVGSTMVVDGLVRAARWSVVNAEVGGMAETEAEVWMGCL